MVLASSLQIIISKRVGKILRHEIVSVNPDIEAKFYLSEDMGSFVTPHWHNDLEMVYVLEGSLIVTYENKKEILNAGEFNIVNSRTVHSVLSTKNRAFVLQVPLEVLKKYIPNIESYIFEVSMQPSNAVEKTRLERIKKIFADMYTVYDVRPDGYLLKFNSLLYDLLFTLVHSYAINIGQKDFARNDQHLSWLSEVISYLKEHHREKCTVSSLAEQFGYSSDYLARTFKKYIGMTITDYLYAVRVTYVYRDLIQTEKSINDIFYEHGCSNYRVAMREFKEKYGCTPKEKRNSIKK